MLRITEDQQEEGRVSLCIEGRLAGSSCDVLEGECQRWTSLGKHVLIDLSRLTLIDRRGTKLLMSLKLGRVDVIRVPPLIADLLLDAEP